MWCLALCGRRSRLSGAASRLLGAAGLPGCSGFVLQQQAPRPAACGVSSSVASLLRAYTTQHATARELAAQLQLLHGQAPPAPVDAAPGTGRRWLGRYMRSEHFGVRFDTWYGTYRASMTMKDSEGEYGLNLGTHASMLGAATLAAAARHVLRGKASRLLTAEEYEQHPLVQRLRQLPPSANREVTRAVVNDMLGSRRNDKTNRTSTVYIGVWKADKGYAVKVTYEGKQYNFSGHSTQEQAAHTYNALAQQHMHSDKAQLNDLTGLQLQPLPAELQAVLARPDLQDGHELLEEAVNAWRRSFKAQCSSRFQGVFKVGKRWRAQINIAKIKHHLGRYASELAAARMYDCVLIQQGLVGQLQRRLNFPEAEYAGDPLLAEWRGLPIEEVRKRCLREAKRERSGAERVARPTRSSAG